MRYLNPACTHKRTTHAHGTHACYTIDKCRCDLCRMAATAYERLRRAGLFDAEIGIGERRLVDATEAVAHIRTLQAAGLGWQQIAKRAGVDPSCVYPLIWGRPDRHHGKPRTKCRPATRDAILAVPIPTIDELQPGRVVDGQPTMNRIRALHHLGYGAKTIADLAGIDHQPIYRALDGSATTVRTHTSIADLFNQLSLTPRPAVDWHDKAAATRARNIATKHAWPAPLDLDEDGYLDQLDDTTGDLDHAAVFRAIQGDRTVTLTPTERVHVTNVLTHEHGMNREEIARHIGVDSRTLLRDAKQEAAA